MVKSYLLSCGVGARSGGRLLGLPHSARVIGTDTVGLRLGCDSYVLPPSLSALPSELCLSGVRTLSTTDNGDGRDRGPQRSEVGTRVVRRVDVVTSYLCFAGRQDRGCLGVWVLVFRSRCHFEGCRSLRDPGPSVCSGSAKGVRGAGGREVSVAVCRWSGPGVW